MEPLPGRAAGGPGGSVPRFVSWKALAPARSDRLRKTRFTGVWIVGAASVLSGPANVAVIGSRAPSEGALARAKSLAETLARAGICVVSGLALGIDGAAHAGALAAGASTAGGSTACGCTAGVLGGGHGHFFPRRNRSLGDAIVAAGGAVLSPFAPGEPARPGQFLARNGVVAALCDAVVVVEAAARSGALNTASWAADLGVDVLAYPGDVDRPKAAGCNALIRDGATLVRGPDDVLEALGRPQPASASSALGSAPTTSRAHEFERLLPLERRVIARLAAGPADFEALVAAAAAPTAELAAALVTLELGGFLTRETASATYALTAR
jgi:DNA processing protein